MFLLVLLVNLLVFLLVETSILRVDLVDPKTRYPIVLQWSNAYQSFVKVCMRLRAYLAYA